MTRPIYMDNHATTRVDPRVVAAMLPYFDEYYGNPSSRPHTFGAVAEAAVDAAREKVATLIGARDPGAIHFTSGATESDNLAIKGVAHRRRAQGDHIVTTAIEHPAVLDSCRHLEKQGFSVTYVRVGADGIVDPNDIASALTSRTVLVSVMLANNEIGTIQPIEEIGRMTSDRGIAFHCDAVQGIGRTPFDVEHMGVDLVSLSAHKMYGPKGVGALYVRPGTPRICLEEQMHGGGHERGLRSGTLNVPGIVGFGEACAILSAEGEEESARIAELRHALHSALVRDLGCGLNGHAERRLPGNLNLRFPGVDAQALLVALRRHVALSTGSACNSAALESSHVLRAIGVPDELAYCSVRFGLGRFNTSDQVHEVAQLVADQVVRQLSRHDADRASAMPRKGW